MSCTANTDSITLDETGGVLSAEINVDPSADNILVVTSDGLYVPPQNESSWYEVTDEAWAWTSSDAPSYTIAAQGDLTSKYKVGQKFMMTQTTDKFFYITKVAYDSGSGLTTLTLYGGTDYTITVAAITEAWYSTGKIPTGFPADPTKWSVTVTDTSDRTQANAAQNTWYNPGTLGITLPIGAWFVEWEAWMGTDSGGKAIEATLSTANNSETDAELTGGFRISAAELVVSVGRRKPLVVTTKTPYFLNIRTITLGTPTIGFYAATYATTTIRARSAYYL